MSEYFPVHAHSQFSWMDGLDGVQAKVRRVAELGMPADALTDHGTMAGAVQHYRACTRAGIAPFIGAEWYLVRDATDPGTNTDRTHLGLLALDLTGYRALVKLSTLSWSEGRFYYKPLIDLGDLAFLHDEGYSDHIALTTGCYGGMLVQTLIDQGYDPARSVLQMFAKWFPNTTYVELQHHGMGEVAEGFDENLVMHALARLADDNGLPVVVGADSHYTYPSAQPVHDLMKDICYFGAGEDSHFSGGPYHVLSATEALAPFLGYQDRIEEGHADLLDKYALAIPALDGYRFHVPTMVRENPDSVLRKLAEDALVRLGMDYVDGWARLDSELDVIAKLGMANYFLLVKEHVTDWCRQNGIVYNTRGSANGSLVCYVLGITNVNPLAWGTSFARFLSLNRRKPPDIDVDVDFRGRGRLITHLRAVFPTTVQIGTYQQIGFNSPDPVTGEDRGSVVVQYMAAMRKKTPDFDGRIKPEHRDSLMRLAQTPCYRAMGTNAAGFILPADDLAVSDYLPLARIISSDTTVTQFPKDDVEALGYMKMDILGLKTLQTLNGTLQRLGKPLNEWDWIPTDDRKACAVLASGRTVGVFQYEGYSQGRGGREMGVKSTLDAIVGTALYRPALVDGGQKDVWLYNRANPRDKQVRLHPVFDPVLDVSLGVPVFQEQIMEMLQVLGMAYDDYNDLMTAVKASNAAIHNAGATFERLMPVFYDLCEERGLDDDQADEAWSAVVGFTEYGFNRAHATSYGLMAYYAAYLNAHHPFEFFVSALDTHAGDADHERPLTAEARRLGFKVVKASVNVSEASWEADPQRTGCIRKGLVSIKGVGWKAAVAIVEERRLNGPFTSVEDFVLRTPRRPVSGGSDYKRTGALTGVCQTLREAGAFRDFD